MIELLVRVAFAMSLQVRRHLRTSIEMGWGRDVVSVYSLTQNIGRNHKV